MNNYRRAEAQRKLIYFRKPRSSKSFQAEQLFSSQASTSQSLMISRYLKIKTTRNNFNQITRKNRTSMESLRKEDLDLRKSLQKL
jgi:hypothetical protein